MGARALSGPEAGGIVYLVGAGPGDPRLLTLRGLEVLQRAEVVVYDHLASSRLLGFAPSMAVRIAAGKSIGHKTMSQDQINATLADHAQRGLRVVRLKGGDPYVFGRGGEEAEYLHALGIPFEVVPGVTAGLGATTYAGIAVTHRESSSAVAFVTGHDDPHNVGRLDWPALARFPGTLVIYMGVTRLRQNCQTLIDGGKSPETPAAMIEAGTLPRQKTVAATLATLPDRALAEGVGFPALLVVGEVVARREPLNWFETLPLAGQRIVVTRPVESGDDSARRLEELGAEVLLAPTIEILPIADLGPLDAALDRLEQYDWLVFTSANGVRHFLDRLLEQGGDLRRLGSVQLAAIGSATAEALSRYLLRADLLPESSRSEALAEMLRDRVRGSRVLLARADRGRTVLQEELGLVATVEQVAVYQNRDVAEPAAEVLSRIEAGTVDWITLTSSASAERLFAWLSPTVRDLVGSRIKLATIGPVTSATVVRLGWRVAVEAEDSSWEGLVRAILAQTGLPPA